MASGKVEGLVGYSRRNFMVPMPRFASWDAFNDYLEEQCLKRQADMLRGYQISIGERLQADLAAMQALPAAPFEACDLRSGQVTSTSVVRYPLPGRVMRSMIPKGAVMITQYQ